LASTRFNCLAAPNLHISAGLMSISIFM
jgi:hypothetical protein